MVFILPFPALYPILRSGLMEQDFVYLVGGVVRDILLSRAPNDIDVIVQANSAQVKAIARIITNHFHGGMYALDEERCTYRVFAQDADGKEWKIDIAQLRGSSLAEDLRMRDFTINAIALDITTGEKSELIDLTGGVIDLSKRKLRPVTADSLSDDSIRVLRGIRLALEFDLQLDADVLAEMKNMVSELRLISGERFRDELFRLLATRYAQKGLGFLYQIGVFQTLFNVESSFLDAAQTETLWWLDQLSQQSPAEDINIGTSSSILAGIARESFTYLNGCISAERSRLALLKLIFLFSGSMDYEKKIEYFAFSQQEQNFIGTVLQFKEKLKIDAKNKADWDQKDVYRFFKSTRDAGAGICFLALAEAGFDQDGFDSVVGSVCQTLLNAYFKNYATLINPEPLLNGDDIMKILDIPAGPKIGIYLEMLKEARVSGMVHNREEAVCFLKGSVASNHACFDADMQ